MKKDAYMSALKSALTYFDDELVQEIIGDYEERFRIGAEKGKSEEQIIEELGTVQDLVEELGEMQHSCMENVSAGKKETEEDTVNFREQENGETEYDKTEQSSSGTYYQKKDFTDSFDSAMKKFGRVLDDVMKEAGRVIDEAAEQLKYHTEEARKTHHYTYYGEENFESTEKEAEGEPNVEQSAAGTTDCCKVIVDADIADVKIRMSKDTKPEAVCHYYSHKTAMLYPFYAKQEGDTFYVGVHRQQKSDNKSGFFQFSMSPSIEIELFLPESITNLNIKSSNGDMDFYGVNTKTVELCSKNGDMIAEHLTADKLIAETLSGDLNFSNLVFKVGNVATKSGDCRINNIDGKSLMLRTASGEMDIRYFEGKCLEAVSASGDIFLKADCGKYSLSSQSGDIELESCHDADISLSNTSGDASIRILDALETYQVTMHSVSGECSTMGKTKSDSSQPTRTIEAKTISGDVEVYFCQE